MPDNQETIQKGTTEMSTDTPNEGLPAEMWDALALAESFDAGRHDLVSDVLQGMDRSELLHMAALLMALIGLSREHGRDVDGGVQEWAEWFRAQSQIKSPE